MHGMKHPQHESMRRAYGDNAFEFILNEQTMVQSIPWDDGECSSPTTTSDVVWQGKAFPIQGPSDVLLSCKDHKQS